MELAAGAGATAIARSFFIPEGRPEGTLPQGTSSWRIRSRDGEANNGRSTSIWIWRARLDVPLVLNVPQAIDAPGVHVHVSGISGLIHATRRAASRDRCRQRAAPPGGGVEQARRGDLRPHRSGAQWTLRRIV